MPPPAILLDKDLGTLKNQNLPVLPPSTPKEDFWPAPYIPAYSDSTSLPVQEVAGAEPGPGDGEGREKGNVASPPHSRAHIGRQADSTAALPLGATVPQTGESHQYITHLPFPTNDLYS